MCISSENDAVLSILLRESSLDLDVQNTAGEGALWLAIQQPPPFLDSSPATRLVAQGASVNATNSVNGKF